MSPDLALSQHYTTPPAMADTTRAAIRGATLELPEGAESA
jgi:hypothetical protein